MRTIAFLVLACLLTALPGCATGMAGAQPGQACGDAPADYREMVNRYLTERFQDRFMYRDTIIHSPQQAWLASPDGQDACGYAGRLTARVRDAKDSPWERRSYCYFIKDGAIVTFDEPSNAPWCHGE